jgi:uncharacterized membrane protein (DUF4010 family)
MIRRSQPETKDFMDLASTFADLGIALGVGLLVGLQREQVATQLAGLRTFALITLLGTLCGLLATAFGGLVIAAGFLALTGAIMIGHLAEIKGEKIESGATTEVAALAMFGVGAYIVLGHREVAIALGGGIAALLHFKGALHGIAARLGTDSRAIMQFALISMVVLPVLPNRTFGPYDVLNPRQVWLMVVLIAGIGLGGYIAYKFLGASTGILLAGILGGIVSSTATTVSYAKRAAKHEISENSSAIVILLASFASLALVLVEIGVVAPAFLRASIVPIGSVVATLGIVSLLFIREPGQAGEMPTQANPTELKSAVYFAAIYALILLAIAAVKDAYGVRGLYAVAVASGVAEVHALTLSTSQLVQTGRMSADQGWRVIAAALMSNLAFKGAVVIFLGNWRLWRKIATAFSAAVVVGIGLLVFLS